MLNIIDADGNVVDTANSPTEAQGIVDALQRKTRQMHTIAPVKDSNVIDLRESQHVTQ